MGSEAYMETFKMIFYVILDMSLVSSVIGVITLILKNILKSKISPKWLITLWVVFLVTLINPFRIQSDFSIYNIINLEMLIDNTDEITKEALDKHTNKSYLDYYEKYKEIDSNTENQNTTVEKNNAGTTNLIRLINAKINNLKWNIILILINNWNKIFELTVVLYFIVILSKLIISILTKIRVFYNTRIEFENERLIKIFKEAKSKLNIEEDIKLIKQDLIETPAIYGIQKTKILLKEEILNMSDEEIELILLHELLHMKNGDIIINSLLQALKIIHWFNPLIIIILNTIKKDVELSNDELVIENIAENKIKTYCKTLLKVSLISNKDSCMALGIVSRTKDLEERIIMIKDNNNFIKNKILIISIISVLVLGITVCFATSNLVTNNYETNNMLNSISYSELEENIKTIENKYKQTGLKNTINPIDGDFVLTAGYGRRMHPIAKEYIEHTGIDIARSGISGDKVMAVANGVIEYAGYDSENGNSIEIKHLDEQTGEVLYTYYAHLANIEVEKGQYIGQGEKIGTVGCTGMATGPHLHFEVRDVEKSPVDPTKYIEIQ